MLAIWAEVVRRGGSRVTQNPPTARILQISSKETITYDMPWTTYELIRDLMDQWQFHHGRRDKPTVEKALCILDRAGAAFGFDARKDVVVKRAPTRPAIKGLSHTAVWYDEFKYSEELT
jgi:hypothetical protein